MTKSTEILEALKMQPLTEEEKASRHILGRWYGPIATCNESTRNGRRYNRELWERALNDELFHEKIANKCLFLELGHPQDREETDMSKVCACIPEMPKIINGDLCACVDILDTPNGKILKTLCDYGFVPGISSSITTSKVFSVTGSNPLEHIIIGCLSTNSLFVSRTINISSTYLP